MHVDDFIEELRQGPLSNIALGTEPLEEDGRLKLLTIINRGLRMISARFPYIQRELIVCIDECTTIYPLRKEHSMAMGGSLTRFIDDNECDVFDGGLIKILEVYDRHGHRIPINDPEHPRSVFTIGFDTLQVPGRRAGERLHVLYQAEHAMVGDEGIEDIYLPPMLTEGMLSWVASKVYSSMNGDGHKATAIEHMQLFDAACVEAESSDFAAVSQKPVNNKLEMRGYV